MSFQEHALAAALRDLQQPKQPLSVCTAMSRDDAKKHCESMNATMPIIRNKAENDFISLLIRSGPGEPVQRSTLWIGLKRDRSHRRMHFAWDNGDDGNFEGWARGEPNDWGGSEDCVQVSLSVEHYHCSPW
ncbi:unnamed protein product [Nippostrongylus brasiliensis]|uniref:C-type lectin domain-containing protein n=1 Tax=Nippostrongylus brasiliensis TaxID=27835 RepID=A0A0N4YJL2_NIPBR|nr:unnamed protein product [Nippostrongylus brasiliensis]